MLKANPDHKEIESCASLIAKALNTDRDPLQRAEQQLGITEVPTPVPGAGTAVTAMEQEFAEDDETSPVEARLQRVKQWREMAVRGAAGEKFRRDVRSTYDFRCLFTGQRLPKTEATDSATVVLRKQLDFLVFVCFHRGLPRPCQQVSCEFSAQRFTETWV